MDKKKRDGETPIIDFSELSFEDNAKMAVIEARVGRLAIIQQRVQHGGETPELLDEMVAITSPAAMQEVFDQIREQMAQVVRYVPRDWFTSKAPETLDFGLADTYKHLRADKAAELRQMILTARQPSEVTKN